MQALLRKRIDNQHLQHSGNIKLGVSNSVQEARRVVHSNNSYNLP